MAEVAAEERPPGRRQSAAVSLTPSIIVSSYEIRRPVDPGVVARRGDDLGHRPAPVERDEHVAERIAGGMQADGEGELRAERGQPTDPGDDAARADA